MNKRNAQSDFQQHRYSIRRGVRRQQAVDFFNVLTGPLLLELTEARSTAASGTALPAYGCLVDVHQAGAGRRWFLSKGGQWVGGATRRGRIVPTQCRHG